MERIIIWCSTWICVGDSSLVPAFNIYLNDLFLFFNKTDVCNFDNNATLFMCFKNLAELLEKF